MPVRVPQLNDTQVRNLVDTLGNPHMSKAHKNTAARLLSSHKQQVMAVADQYPAIRSGNAAMRGLYNGISYILGAPVDLSNFINRQLKIQELPYGGSDHLQSLVSKYVVPDPKIGNTTIPLGITANERVAGRVGEEIGAGVASLAPIAGVASRVPAVGQAVGNPLAAGAVAGEVASATGAGVGAGLALEMGAGPVGETVGALAGSFTPGAVAGAGRKVGGVAARATKASLDALGLRSDLELQERAKGVAQTTAGRIIRENTQDPAKASRNILRYQNYNEGRVFDKPGEIEQATSLGVSVKSDTVPTWVVAGDPGLRNLTKALSAKYPGFSQKLNTMHSSQLNELDRSVKLMHEEFNSGSPQRASEVANRYAFQLESQFNRLITRAELEIQKAVGVGDPTAISEKTREVMLLTRRHSQELVTAAWGKFRQAATQGTLSPPQTEIPPTVPKDPKASLSGADGTMLRKMWGKNYNDMKSALAERERHLRTGDPVPEELNERIKTRISRMNELKEGNVNWPGGRTPPRVDPSGNLIRGADVDQAEKWNELHEEYRDIIAESQELRSDPEFQQSKNAQNKLKGELNNLAQKLNKIRDSHDWEQKPPKVSTDYRDISNLADPGEGRAVPQGYYEDGGARGAFRLREQAAPDEEAFSSGGTKFGQEDAQDAKDWNEAYDDWVNLNQETEDIRRSGTAEEKKEHARDLVETRDYLNQLADASKFGDRVPRVKIGGKVDEDFILNLQDDASIPQPDEVALPATEDKLPAREVGAKIPTDLIMKPVNKFYTGLSETEFNTSLSKGEQSILKYLSAEGSPWGAKAISIDEVIGLRVSLKEQMEFAKTPKEKSRISQMVAAVDEGLESGLESYPRLKTLHKLAMGASVLHNGIYSTGQMRYIRNEGAVGQILRNEIPASSTLSRMLHAGYGSKEDAITLKKVLAGHVDEGGVVKPGEMGKQENDMIADYLSRVAYDFSSDASGQINPEKFDQWRKNFKDVIREFPAVAPRLARASSVAQFAKDFELDKKRLDRIVNQRHTTLLLQDDPANAVGQVFKGSGKVMKARQLYSMVRKDEGAKTGLRQAFWDHFSEKFQVNSLELINSPVTNPRVVMDFISDKTNQSAMKALGFEEGHIRNIRDIANQLYIAQKTSRAITQNANLDNFDQSALDIGGITMSGLASRFYSIARGVVSPRFVATEVTGRLVNNKLNQFTMEETRRLLEEALTRPEIAQTMLRPLTEASVDDVTRTLRAHLVSLGWRAESREDEPSSRPPPQSLQSATVEAVPQAQQGSNSLGLSPSF